MNTTHTPAEWAARNAEMLKDAWAEGDHLRTINAELVDAIEGVLHHEIYGTSTSYPAALQHCRAVLARARGTA